MLVTGVQVMCDDCDGASDPHFVLLARRPDLVKIPGLAVGSEAVKEPREQRPGGTVLWARQDPKGRVVALYESTWEGHIQDHRELDSPYSIADLIEDPDYLVRDVLDPATRYYARGKVEAFRNMLLAAIVRWDGRDAGSGWVKTSYVTKRPKADGELEWVRPGLR